MKKITNDISTSTKKSMLTRIITGIVLALVSIPCLVLGSWYFFGLTVLITFIAAYETVKVTDLKGLMKIFIYLVNNFILLLRRKITNFVTTIGISIAITVTTSIGTGFIEIEKLMFK